MNLSPPEIKGIHACPWCGTVPSANEYSPRVECPKCTARGPIKAMDGHAAVREWNRIARAEPPRYPPKNHRAKCADCDRPYGNAFGFPDLVIPNDAWRRISPDGNLSGLLCPSCICARLAEDGMSRVPGAFMSGPIDSVSQHVMHAYRMAENVTEEANNDS